MGPHVVGEAHGRVGALEPAGPGLGEETPAGEVVTDEEGLDPRVPIAEEAHGFQEYVLTLVGGDVPDAEQRGRTRGGSGRRGSSRASRPFGTTCTGGPAAPTMARRFRAANSELAT